LIEMTWVNHTRNQLRSHALLIIVAVVIGVAIASVLHPLATRPAQSADPTAPALVMQQAFINVVDNVKPAVVNISTEEKVSRRRGTDDFWEFFPPWALPERPRDEKRTRLGSGVIIDKQGHILTAAHVVEDVESGGEIISVRVTLTDGEEYEGNILGTDPPSDLAVIKIDPRRPLAAAPLGDGGDVKVGEWVLAMGSPFDLEASVTAGIISGTGRGFRGDVAGARSNMIQTDAAINSGNSGGPLVNLRGEVIGINRAIVSPNQGNVGLGFAIPIDTFARDIIDTLKKGEKVERGQLGVKIQDLTPRMREAFGVDSGAYVTQVFPDTPAAEAGVKADDIIVEFDGKPVGSVDELMTAVQGTKPGSQAKLVVVREGKRQTLSIEVGGMETVRTGNGGPAEAGGILGMTVAVRDIEARLARRYGLADNKAVVVTAVSRDGLASRYGLEQGDVVLMLNGVRVSTIADYNRGIAAVERQGYALIRVGRDGNVFLVTIAEVRKRP
jgi:Do/DeqQ family serine protease